MKTQESWTIKKLQENGKVSRNEALQSYISRLGAIICSLNKSGWVIEGKFEKYAHGKDYVYRVVKSPFRKVERFVPALDKKIITYEKI